MFCRYCGKELSEDAKFCPECGASVDAQRQPFETGMNNNAGNYNAGNGYGNAGNYNANANKNYANANDNAPANGEEKKPPKVWFVFARISKILGIACLATSWIPYLDLVSLSLGIVGIVMACLGRKANTEETDKFCSIGLKLSIAAVVVSAISFILWYMLFLGALLGSVSYVHYLNSNLYQSLQELRYFFGN